MTQGDLAILFSRLDDLGKDVREGLGEVRTELAEQTRTVASLDKSCALVTRDVAALSKRVGGLEGWRREHDDEANRSGRHKLKDVETRLALVTQQRDAELADTRKARIEFVVKAALLTLGAVLAVMVPAIAQALGIG